MVTSLSAAFNTPYGSGFEAVVFDCDGVLVDTEYLKFLAWQEALHQKNIPFSFDEYRPLAGHSGKNILQMIRKEKQLEISEEVIELKNTHYRFLQSQGVVPIREMVAFVNALAQKKEEFDIKLAVASSAPREEIFLNLQQIGLEGAFDLIVSGSCDFPQGKNKPHPYIYQEVARQLHVSPSKCLVFEDTSVGIEAALGAGMTAIAVPNQYTSSQDFSTAHQVIRSYSKVQALL